MNQTRTPRTVLLAGASGVLGRHIARALTTAGHRVVPLGRGPENAVRADLLDRAGLLRAVDGLAVDTVVHAATALRKPPMRHGDMAATDALRIQGTANLLDAARATGARRFVAESMIFGYGYGDHGDRVLHEDTDVFGPKGSTRSLEQHIGAMRTKEAMAFSAVGMDGIALRFGLLYGEGGTDALLPMLRRRSLPLPEDHGRVLPWVELPDAGWAVVAAVERGRSGQAYNIADDEPIGFGGHVRAVAEAFGLPRPMTVPLGLLRPMSYAYAAMSTSMRVSNAKARDELGWAPTHRGSVAGLRSLAAATRRAA
ncbi:NAD-dependent epimerase/dehydratase family protein [Streptomyces sp. 8N706]|uniref:NAD-dependent epimerase/dehydratase family protein n=1 Tax=Streptomyces sp. 8N706 TaxID=3457416 RepID=UPI003FCF6181